METPDRFSASLSAPRRTCRPVGRVIELIGHLGRPVTAHVAIEEIALDRLAQSRRAARAIHFPSRREHGRAPERNARPPVAAAVARRCSATTSSSGGFQLPVDLRCLLVDSFQCIHQCLLTTPSPGHRLTVELREERGVPHRQLSVHAQADVRPPADPVAVMEVRPAPCRHSACVLRDNSRPSRAASPSTCCSRSSSRRGVSRETRAAPSRSMPSRTVPSLCSSEPAKRWHSATSPPVDTPIRPSPAPHGYALLIPCGSRRASR